MVCTLQKRREIKEMKKGLKKTQIWILLLEPVIAYFLTIYVINRNFENLFAIDFFLFLLIWIAIFFVFSHFLFPIKKIYEVVFHKRYWIAFCLLAIIVLGKFNGSSYGIWDDYIEPNYKVSSLKPIYGEERSIRSDEWLVNSSYTQSQIETGYAYFNEHMRAEKTDIFATVPSPIKNILVLTKPFLIGFLLLGRDYGMSFYWYGRLIVLFLVTFEFLRILTKDKRVSSALGSILITFSAAVFWWYSQYLIEILIGGCLSIIMFHQFLKSETVKQKILYAIFIALSFLVFVFPLYPAWLIPFGIFFLIIAINELKVHYADKKIKIKDFIPLALTIFIIASFVLYFYINSKETISLLMHTIYPGSRVITGGQNYENLFYYPVAILFPYYNVGNPCEMSTFYSFYPFCLILAIYTLIKERKKSKENGLLLWITILLLFFSSFAFFPFPEILAKITLMSFIPVERLTIVMSYLGIILMMLLMEKQWTKKEKIIFSILGLASSWLCFYFIKKGMPDGYITMKKTIVIGLCTIIPNILFLFNNKKARSIFMIIMILISIISTIRVNPIMKGFSGIYEKPISKELQHLKTENKTWIALDSFVIPNYLGAHGLKVINATNTIPNFKLWEKIDPKKKYEHIYNRYAHITMTIGDETKFELIQPDRFDVSLSPTDFCKLNVNYVTSLKELKSNEKMNLEEKYRKDNIYIYKVECLGE